MNCFVNTYPLDSDLSGGYRYPAFEQPGPSGQGGEGGGGLLWDLFPQDILLFKLENLSLFWLVRQKIVSAGNWL